MPIERPALLIVLMVSTFLPITGEGYALLSPLVLSSPARPVMLTADHPPLIPDHQYLGIFYYGWYGNASDGWSHWNMMNENPPQTWSSNYLPDIGIGYDPTHNLYDSGNQTIQARQVREIANAGVDFAIYSWWGRGTIEDRNLRSILDISNRIAPNLKWAILYEKDALADPSIAQIISDLNYIETSYANNPVYLRINGKPVVLVFRGEEASITSYAQRWMQARDAMYDQGAPFFIILHAWKDFKSQTFPGTSLVYDYEHVVDSWFDYVPASYNRVSSYSAYVQPGYYEFPQLCQQRWAGVECEKVSRDPAQFSSSLQKLSSLSFQQAQFKYIISFNEYHEGTMVEPAYPVKTDPAGYTQNGASWGTEFLDLIKNYFWNKTSAMNEPSQSDSNSSLTSQETRNQAADTGSSSPSHPLTLLVDIIGIMSIGVIGTLLIARRVNKSLRR